MASPVGLGIFGAARLPVVTGAYRCRRHIATRSDAALRLRASPALVPNRSAPSCSGGIARYSVIPSGSPAPLSSTSIRTRPSAACARSTTQQSASENLNAFCRRFATAEASMCRSGAALDVRGPWRGMDRSAPSGWWRGSHAACGSVPWCAVILEGARSPCGPSMSSSDQAFRMGEATARCVPFLRRRWRTARRDARRPAGRQPISLIAKAR